jgi:hypothetical protein
MSDLRKANEHRERRLLRMAAYRQRTKPILLLRLGIRNGWIR